MRDPFDRFEASLDQVVSALAQDLDVNVVRDHLPVGKLTEEIKLDLGSSRETDLDLLEAQLQEKAEHLHLLLNDHRLHQSLVSVSKIHGAPARRLFDLLVGPFSLRIINDRVPLISFNMVHNYLLCCCGLNCSGFFCPRVPSAAVRPRFQLKKPQPCSRSVAAPRIPPSGNSPLSLRISI